ncbi:hypothetical protein VSH64_43715 [Amycolatopsis rhabdoformis]|uniref:Uncharacterized protein n=1 Tax=Amycolatopsis rhabdoformis TaxID=1448059 RepID=A0ABZ1I7V8_9PSEU|nr:hypothetical protein [Amycolatopsis rhabdoformis]WSE29633.1 hypothetical protein VSH64_43715 [Amycolatopsis rhabdoformis]
MNSNMMLLNPGTGLSGCGLIPASRQGTGVSIPGSVTSAHVGGFRRVEERTWTPADVTVEVTLAPAALVGAYPQVDVDQPTIKKFRVPLSIRERSS